MQKPKKKNKEIPEFERGRERGRREGINEGYEFAMVIILMVLKDKFGTSNEEIRRIAEDIQSYTAMVRSGRVRFDLGRRKAQEKRQKYMYSRKSSCKLLKTTEHI